MLEANAKLYVLEVCLVYTRKTLQRIYCLRETRILGCIVVWSVIILRCNVILRMSY